jgi:DNA-binding transcriptional regulator YiaG
MEGFEDSELDLIPDLNKKARIKTSNRLNYEAQVEVIKKQIGDIEVIRNKLNLSQRKMAQLLLVDPSAWSRWSTPGESAPPHIYRALQWYMSIQEQIPGLNAAYFLQKDTDVLKKELKSFTETQVQEIEKSIATLQARTAEIVHHSSKDILKLEDEVQGLRVEVIDARKELKKSQENLKLLKKRVGFVFLIMFFVVIIIALQN